MISERYIDVCKIGLLLGAVLFINTANAAELNDEVFKALMENDLKQVESIIEKRKDALDSVDSNKWTPLHYASTGKDIRILDYLLSKVPDVNIKSGTTGDTPLLLAAKFTKHGEFVQHLLMHKADYSIADSDGFTPLHAAAMKGNNEAIKVLLSAGADANLNGDCGTPLHQAAFGGNVETIKLFIELKCDVNTKDGQGKVPLQCAAERGCLGAVQILLENGAKVGATDNDGRTALHFASLGTKKAAADSLVRTIASNINFRTTLNLVAKVREHKQVIELLLKSKATINAKGKDGCTPLHEAALLGRVDLVETLLSNGADPNLTNAIGQTPLHSVCSFSGVRRIAEDLLNQKADISILDSHKRSPLRCASEFGGFELVSFLLEKGANINEKDDSGISAAQKLRNRVKDVPEFSALLEKYEAK